MFLIMMIVNSPAYLFYLSKYSFNINVIDASFNSFNSNRFWISKNP